MRAAMGVLAVLTVLAKPVRRCPPGETDTAVREYGPGGRDAILNCPIAFDRAGGAVEMLITPALTLIDGIA